MQMFQRWVCRLFGHDWSQWVPVNPARVVREPWAPYLAIRYCVRCHNPDELQQREPNQMPDGQLAS